MNASATWSSSYSVENIIKATGYWASGQNKKSGWIEFHFPSPVTLSGFRYKSADKSGYKINIFKDFRFEISHDESWKTVLRGRGEKRKCCEWWQEITFYPVTSNLFRLVMFNTWGGGFLASGQLEFRYAAEWTSLGDASLTASSKYSSS